MTHGGCSDQILFSEVPLGRVRAHGPQHGPDPRGATTFGSVNFWICQLSDPKGSMTFLQNQFRCPPMLGLEEPNGPKGPSQPSNDSQGLTWNECKAIATSGVQRPVVPSRGCPWLELNAASVLGRPIQHVHSVQMYARLLLRSVTLGTARVWGWRCIAGAHARVLTLIEPQSRNLYTQPRNRYAQRHTARDPASHHLENRLLTEQLSMPEMALVHSTPPDHTGHKKIKRAQHSTSKHTPVLRK